MNKDIDEAELRELLPDCCRIGFASVDEYYNPEKEQLLAQLPSTRTVIVIAHHVMDSLEWTWLKFQAARGGETSPADIHTLAMAERVTSCLKSIGCQSTIVPYPGVCGLMFKKIALPTQLGSLGDNFLFMNNEWGPWIHLRVILTNSIIRHVRPEIRDACTHCGECIKVCPAGAIQHGRFDGLACRAGMREMSRTQCDGSFCFECELCLRACPVGTRPRKVQVTFNDKVN